ncbi:hypothetical protein N9B60_02335 [Mariniblastus sp.]|nr:hypothetical protein [Mariniblastus sp.]
MENRIPNQSEPKSLDSTDVESDGVPSMDSTETANLMGSSFGKVIRWTSNLIATGLVIAIVITFGPELISSVLPAKTANNVDKLDIVEDWPTFQQSDLEFGDAGYQLSRSRFSGEIENVFDLLENLCREQLQTRIRPFGEIGLQEKKFIEDQNGREPVESIAGKYRIFCERSKPMLAGFPTAIGIRDDCEQEKIGLTSRMTVWAMAMPAGENQWTTFVGTSAIEKGSQWIERMIPTDSVKNISLSDKKGGAVIGFAGGDMEKAIEFYQRFEQVHHCELQNIQKAETSWNGSVVLDDGEKTLEVRIQLAQPQGKELTGILMKKSSGKTANPSRSQLTLREGIKYE